ncbi:hypothetical protein E3N88_17576 [Mikania micrantha]|uniref:Uncharacterized protein n=1 Tax=Mikania micrantha TaxID=192012 RepID=A0A5N6NTQ7_9ASTR|nr:hypothetical protein E3N88_17576 [Mikania micrantha]
MDKKAEVTRKNIEFYGQITEVQTEPPKLRRSAEQYRQKNRRRTASPSSDLRLMQASITIDRFPTILRRRYIDIPLDGSTVTQRNPNSVVWMVLGERWNELQRREEEEEERRRRRPVWLAC